MGCCGKKSVPVEDDQTKNDNVHTKNPSEGDILHLGKTQTQYQQQTIKKKIIEVTTLP